MQIEVIWMANSAFDIPVLPPNLYIKIDVKNNSLAAAINLFKEILD